MAEKSRTEYSARNTTVAMVARVIAILAGYLTRVVFTHTLTKDYVGINGLFTDILNVLALSELGVGTAITYVLYQPISQGDQEKQKSLMRMYRNFYRLVAVIVLGAGLMVVPFLDILIKDQPQVEHLLFIYLMYLFNSVVSYLLIYKRTLIDAHQQSYIGVLYQTVFLIVQYILQIGVLYFTGNFMLYLSILILCTIGGNVAISRKADRMYPYLRERDAKKLSGEERRDIFQNIRAMLMHKVGNVLVNNTDNLLLSALVGSLSVGSYSNYFLVIGSVRQVLNQMFQGITASVGNLGVEEGRERIKRVFEASFFMGQWLFGLAAICLYEVLDAFVEVSFGAQYVFPWEVTLVLCLNFYLTGMRQATLVFRDSMGIFKYDRYKAIPEAVINLAVSLVLGRELGALGIFLGTMVSTVATSLWVEPYMLYRHRLQTSVKPYFLRYLLYAGVTFGLWWGEDLLCRRITGNPWVVCLLRLALCFVLTNLIFLILYRRTGEFKLLFGKGMDILGKRFPKLFSKTRELAVVKELSAEENTLLLLLREALTGREREGGASSPPGRREAGGPRAFKEEGGLLRLLEESADWEKLCDIAARHGVLPLLYDVVGEREEIPGEVREKVTKGALRAVQQSYHVLFLCKYLVGRLEAAGIPVILLKGVGTASFYPLPELRKLGDVDLLLGDPVRLEEAVKVMEACGCRVSGRQPSLHHVVFETGDGIEVELHTMLAEPFDNGRINQYLEGKLSECAGSTVKADCMGVELPILNTGFHAYELLLHMLQHFLRSGFGLRLLCDWVVFWNRDTSREERRNYLNLVRESGLSGFSEMVTSFCCAYLGLERRRVDWMGILENYDVKGFLMEILEAEEFGKSASDRMVALRGNGPEDYAREFHHQMRLNFPRAGKIFLLWPGLWLVTLFRFLQNNRKVRKVSTWYILKKAGQRSRVMEQIRLWKR